ncbi:glycosyltransferase family 2 protein [Bacillus spongiae]|uniref:Glycosyltransferase family 2 protein n=1 Tax=Bacillus spongiae TaxID=2683610 RepID=A0ABU8HEY6_9BACI
MNNLMVSVVVPIYKVEKYIHRCINSLINQSYKQLEIILVNDGSPDNCGEIVDEYARKDERIKALHKQNGGLSDARNYGMKYVTGGYTIFVDSDDWLEEKMIEELVRCSHELKADLVQSAFYYSYEDALLFDNRNYSITSDPLIMNNKEAMLELVKNEKVKNFAWGKLYKTEMIKDLSFKKGVLFEDVFWAHKVIKRVNKLVLIQKPLYHYFQRSDSIVSTYSLRNLDMIEGLKERLQFIEMHYPELLNESYKQLLKSHLIHYNLLLVNRKKDKRGEKRREIRRYIEDHDTHFQQAVKTDEELKKQLTLFLTHPFIHLLFLGWKKGLRLMKFSPIPKGLEVVDVRSSKEDVIND